MKSFLGEAESCLPSRGPRFESQKPHGASPSSFAPVPGDLTPSSGLICGAQINMEAKRTHRPKTKQLQGRLGQEEKRAWWRQLAGCPCLSPCLIPPSRLLPEEPGLSGDPEDPRRGSQAGRERKVGTSPGVRVDFWCCC